VIFPARQGKARDKALVEGMVKLVYQRIFAPIRDEVFTSIADLNKKIFELTDKHNRTPFQKLKISRYELFEEIEKDKLLPLPVKRYEFKGFAFPTVGINYHIYLSEDVHYYSVPHTFKGKKVKVIYSSTSVEVYYDGKRIASHVRDRKRGGYTTKKDHMPSSHRFYAEWSPESILRWAAKVGPNVRELASIILSGRQYPEQAYRSCIGIIGLARKYGNKRVDMACRRAVSFELYRYKAVRNILVKGLDKVDEEKECEKRLPLHANIRGEEYYKLT
jgi:transposase